MLQEIIFMVLLKDQIQNKLGLKHFKTPVDFQVNTLKDQIQNKLGLKHYEEYFKSPDGFILKIKSKTN